MQSNEWESEESEEDSEEELSDREQPSADSIKKKQELREKREKRKRRRRLMQTTNKIKMFDKMVGLLNVDEESMKKLVVDESMTKWEV